MASQPPKGVPAPPKETPPWEPSLNRSLAELQQPKTLPSAEEDTLITAAPNRVHADLYGAQEALFREPQGFLRRWKKRFFTGWLWPRDFLREIFSEHRRIVFAALGIFIVLLAVAGGFYFLRYGREHPALSSSGRKHSLDEALHSTAEESDTKTFHTDLRLTTVPAGARVYLDGRAVDSLTPLTFSDLEAGREFALEIHLDGYQPLKTNLVLEAQKINDKKFILSPLGNLTLVLSSTPPGAEFVIDDRIRGKTPSQLNFPAHAEDFKLDLSLEGYLPIKQRVPLSAKEDTIHFTLEKRGESARAMGYLTLDAEPWAFVYINGKRQDRRTPLERIQWPVREKLQVRFVNPLNQQELTLRDVVLLPAGAGRYKIQFRPSSFREGKRIKIWQGEQYPTLWVDLR